MNFTIDKEKCINCMQCEGKTKKEAKDICPVDAIK
jgi:ferredoxin